MRTSMILILSKCESYHPEDEGSTKLYVQRTSQQRLNLESRQTPNMAFHKIRIAEHGIQASCQATKWCGKTHVVVSKIEDIPERLSDLRIGHVPAAARNITTIGQDIDGRTRRSLVSSTCIIVMVRLIIMDLLVNAKGRFAGDWVHRVRMIRFIVTMIIVPGFLILTCALSNKGKGRTCKYEKLRCHSGRGRTYKRKNRFSIRGGRIITHF